MTLEILDRLSKWTEDNNKINPEQSGFRKHRGVNDQLFLFQQFVTQEKNSKRHMHAGQDSPSFTPIAGVPQGSCISPILFPLFVSDIPLNSSFLESLLIAKATMRNI